MTKNVIFLEPITPAFEGGEIPCKSPDLLQKNNCIKICKRELNSPAAGRGRGGG